MVHKNQMTLHIQGRKSKEKISENITRFKNIKLSISVLLSPSVRLADIELGLG